MSEWRREKAKVLLKDTGLTCETLPVQQHYQGKIEAALKEAEERGRKMERKAGLGLANTVVDSRSIYECHKAARDFLRNRARLEEK